MSEKTFEQLAQINVSEHIEKKGRFSYLSWPFAVSELCKADPKASWEVAEFDEGMPYKSTAAGCFVKVTVTAFGVSRTQIHPVLDNSNRTVKTPDAFQVNTSIQRCLVKAIALHGIGLYIYAGEDLPTDSDKELERPFNGKSLTEIERELKSCQTKAGLKEVYEDNETYIKALKEADKTKLRATYKSIQDKLKEAA